MKKPYIICHMMTSLDGRIDCAMTSKLKGVERMAVVGGPVINLAILDSGLLDEISILIGAGIDGRRMPSVFDGREAGSDVIPLQLSDVQKFDSGAVWLRYKAINILIFNQTTDKSSAILSALSIERSKISIKKLPLVRS